MVQGSQAINTQNKSIITKILLHVITPILHECLRRIITPADITRKAKNCPSLMLTERQWMELENAQSNGYSNFDISLIYKLSKHTGIEITRPIGGWGLNMYVDYFDKTPITHMRYPKDHHITEGDDIERIYRILNDMFHNTDNDINDDAYEFYWKELQNICGRMEIRHGNTTYNRSIVKIRAGIGDTRSSDTSADKKQNCLSQVWTRKGFIFSLAIIFAIGGILFYQWCPGNEYKNVHAQPAPFKKLKSFLTPMDDLWGTYMPSAYFGFSTVTSHSPFIGLLFLDQQWHSHCDGRIESFGWNRHDGINFGSQSIKRQKLNMTTEFMKDLEDSATWNIRVVNEQIAEQGQLCLIVYVPGNGTIRRCHSAKCRYVIEVETKELDRAFVRITSDKPFEIDHDYVYLETNYFNVERLRQSLNKTKTEHSKQNAIIVCTKSSFPSSFSVRISNHRDDKKVPISHKQFIKDSIIWKEKFNDKFRNTFHLSNPMFSAEEIETAKIALSNVLGSIGYFQGSSVAFDVQSRKLYQYFEESLYTSTPSRVFHAHGHFWDDGFHNMLIAKWDINISLRIMTHWLDLMDNRGWIPREQILDDYSRETIPEKYIPQHNDNVSPPTFLLPLRYIAEYLASGSKDELDFLREILKRVTHWFSWFTSSQAGNSVYSYRWRGRNDPYNVNQTNKMTLASGLDDYPRALIPDKDERHLDLKCWITMAARVLIRLSDLAKAKKERLKFEKLYDELKNDVSLNKFHWDEQHKHYGDYGLHSENVKTPGAFRYKVVDNVGYVSLFPFLLKILEPNAEKLMYIIKDLESPHKLWTNYGIRSLSKSNPYYQMKNEKFDTPQWRGSIRININYLIIGALKYYAEKSAKYGTKFQELYHSLRENVIKNIIKVYKEQGSFYEKYNDINGKGEGYFPSTGTSSMLVLIMSETYY